MKKSLVFGLSSLVLGTSWFLVLLSSISYAQETKQGPVEVHGDQVEYFPQEKKVTGVGNISIDYGEVSLTCDKITVHTETKDAEAEGRVTLRTPQSEIKGERIRYNFNTEVGEILDATVQAGEWYGKGEKIQILSRGSYRVEDGYLTSCDLDDPHYKISAKKVIIYPDNKVVAKDVSFNVGNVPLAYLPRYDFSMETNWPTINVVPGKKSDWGVFALTTYRYEMDEHNNISIKIDAREKWGLGEGFDYKYTTDNIGQGLLRTYYTYQSDRDRNEAIKSEEERYRVQLRHRWDLSDNLKGFFEYHNMNDVDFAKDFFYREEYDREASPESYVYFLDSQSEYSGSFLVRKRVHHFQDVVERLPELKFDLKESKLFDLPVYFRTDTSFTALNKKTANSDTDSDVLRLDSFNKLSSPIRLAGFLSASPFIGMRDTYYSKDINGDEDELRTAFYTGVDISTKVFKTYDMKSSFFGIDLDGLHHIITPTLEYEYIHEPSAVSGNLQQFDDIDNIERKSAFTLGIENRLQTKRSLGGKLATVDLVYFLLTGDYLYREEDGSRFSNIKGDLELTPLKWLKLESDTQYDPATRDFQNWNMDLYIDRDDWRVGFGSRYWQGTEHELTSELSFKLNSEWSFRLFGRFDLKEVESNGHKIINRFDSKEITVIKDLHCWLSEVSLDVDRDGGTTVWLVMKLKAAPKVPVDFGDYYAIPKR